MNWKIPYFDLRLGEEEKQSVLEVLDSNWLTTGPKTDQLADLLRELYQQRDEELRARHNRSLPFADGMFDRWERAIRLGFGEESCVYNSAVVIGDVNVGAHTWVGPNVVLDGGYDNLRIGAYCSISAGACLYTHDTDMWSLSGGVSKLRTGAVTVEDRCYIGSHVIVGPGVRIEQNGDDIQLIYETEDRKR
jgi:hypothetical protein